MPDDYLTEFPEMCLFIDSEDTCVQNAQNEGEFGIFSYLVPLFYLWAEQNCDRKRWHVRNSHWIL